MRIVGAPLLCLLIVMPHASVWSASEAANASRLARQVMKPAQERFTLSPTPACEFEAGFSVARSNDKSLTTSWPFDVSCEPAAGQPWRLGVSGALHSVERVPGQPAVAGFPDVNLEASLSLSGSLTAVLGGVVPTGSQVGSTSGALWLTLLHQGSAAKGWDYLGLIEMDRSQRPAQGLGQVGTTLLGRLKLDLGGSQSMAFELSRSRRSGADGVTVVKASHEMPLWSGFISVLDLTHRTVRSQGSTSAGVTLLFVF